MNHAPVLLLVLAAALAGCLGAEAPPEASVPVPEPMVPDVFGVVFDQDRAPLPGVTVSLFELERHAVTDASGRYHFDNVTDDITFLILAEKEGYLAASQDIQMVPGFAVRVNLTLTDIDRLPEVVIVSEYRGILECQLVTTGPAAITGDCPGTETVHDTWQVPTYPRLKGGLVELFWDANTPSTGNLRATVAASTAEGWQELGSVQGPSPLTFTVKSVDAERVTSGIRVYVEAATATPEGPAAAGTAFEQDFEAFVSLFYNRPGQEGYSVA